MVREGYKQTGIGLIPEDWEPKLLGDVFSLSNGFSFKSEYFSSTGSIVLTPGNFKLEGGLYFNNRNTKRYSGGFSELVTFKNGDLLVVMTDLTPECNLLGKPAFVESEELILHNQRIGKVNLLSGQIDKQFLYFILLSNSYLRKVKEQATGSTVRHTSNKSIYSIVIPIPNKKDEQRLIAQALSDVDALTAALDRTIVKKRNLKTATMQQLLTGKKRLSGFDEGKGYKKSAIGVIPEDWNTAKLGDVAEVIMGQSPKGNSYNRDGNGLPLINGPTEFTDKHPIKVQWTTEPTKLCKSGDLLICVRGSSTGRMNVANGEFCIGRGVSAIRANAKASTEYLTSQVHLALEGLLSLSAGSTFPSVDGKAIKSIHIPCPTPQEQQVIAQVLSDMDAEIAALEARLAKTRAIKQGMMQELLTGRTRLV